MAKLEVRTVEGITLELDVAGPGTRFLAGLLDGLLLGGGFLATAIAFSVLADFDATGFSRFVEGFLILGSVLIVIAYHVLFHALAEGRTPGKQVLGVRVVGLDGQQPALSALVLRGVLTVVDVLPVPVFLGLISIALTPRRQRLGDLLAGTLVTRDPRAVGRGLEPWGTETWSTLQVRVLDLTPAAATRFDRGDLAFLRALITRRGMEALRRRELLRQVARHYRDRLQVPLDEDPRAVIRELYLFLREHTSALRAG